MKLNGFEEMQFKFDFIMFDVSFLRGAEMEVSCFRAIAVDFEELHLLLMD